ncbi:acetyltransferase [Thalassotalea marina]|uniref:Acetyltransferase n=1 Tax=Thalassotalea marina TaxID=1673741 RepID=A0A919EK28_9GAMM|nr:acetyltransferase [Thalassotalea marina]GHF87876.1 acetyltransferase [Thalassotalea marina]
MSKLLIIGAGGHGKVIADCAEASCQFSEIAFLDDSHPERDTNLAWPIIDKSSAWKIYKEEYDFALALGHNKSRLAMYKALQDSNARMPNIVHPRAVVSKHVSLGAANVIFAGAVVNPGVSIGNACIINTGATVDHDCTLGDAIHISPGANLAGTVSVGDLTWFGVGSCSVQSIDIAFNTQVGAGAAVTNSTQASGLYVGVPAKRIKDID